MLSQHFASTPSCRAIAAKLISRQIYFRPFTANIIQIKPNRKLEAKGKCTKIRNLSSTSPAKSGSSNIFLDNLGTLFLGGIVTVIAWLVRSYLNSQARNRLRDTIEDTAHADPIEIDDLRTANTELTAEQFIEIYSHVSSHQEPLRYEEFVFCVREAMARKLGPAFTVQLGHLLDRVAASAMDKRGRSLVSDSMPLLFWLTILSMSVSSAPKDRINILFHVLSENNTKTPSLEDVTELVGYLQDSCQLVPDAQVVATSQQYPLQQYAVASPVHLVDRYRVQYKDEEPVIDCEKFRDMLTSNSICAWGECYKRKR